MPDSNDGDNPRRPTMREIGRALGVTHATVSMALRDHARIPPERREQIKAMAARMGYRPDPALAALSRYRHPPKDGARPIAAEVAWLNFWPEPARLREHREFDAYWRGAEAVAIAHGYRLVEYAPARGIPLRRIEKVLKARHVDGLLLPPPPTSDFQGVDYAGLEFDWAAFSIVRFGHRILDLPVHTVTCDQLACAQLAVEKLGAKGYRRIGFITTQLGLETLRFAPGYLRAQHMLPRGARLPMLTLPQGPKRVHRALLQEWLAAHRPDAIFSAVNNTASLLAELGRRIPEDIALATTSILEGGVDAGINQNSEEIGRTAMEFLLSLVQHGHRGFPRFERQLLVEGTWVDGASLPDRSKPARSVSPASRRRAEATP